MKHKISRQVASSALATSRRRQTRSSQPWLVRLRPTRSAALPASLFAAPDHINSRVCLGVCSNICKHDTSDFSPPGRLFRFAKFTSENANGSKSEAQNRTAEETASCDVFDFCRPYILKHIIPPGNIWPYYTSITPYHTIPPTYHTT